MNSYARKTVGPCDTHLVSYLWNLFLLRHIPDHFLHEKVGKISLFAIDCSLLETRCSSYAIPKALYSKLSNAHVCEDCNTQVSCRIFEEHDMHYISATEKKTFYNEFSAIDEAHHLVGRGIAATEGHPHTRAVRVSSSQPMCVTRYTHTMRRQLDASYFRRPASG